LIRRSFARTLALEVDRAALRGTGNQTAPVDEPRGLRYWPGVPVLPQGTNGAALSSFDAISQAVETVWGANFEPNAAIYAPRTAGVLDRLKEGGTNSPLSAPESLSSLSKFRTNQVSILETQGSATDASSIYVGDFSQLAIGMRSRLRIEVSRTDDYSWNQLAVSIRAYLRADVAVLQPTAFAIVTGIVPA
jgi:HK97 family phage major capsid protein